MCCADGVPSTEGIVVVTARKRSLGQGNIFRNICHSVHLGGGVLCMMSLPVWLHGPMFLVGGLCP